MRTLNHIGNNTVIHHNFNSSNHHRRSIKHKTETGSLTGKYPIILDDGRTIIYINDKSKEDEIRSKYALKKI